MLERLGQERLAALEVVVDERCRDAGVHRDPRDPHGVDSVGRDPLDGGVEDLLPGAAPCRCGDLATVWGHAGELAGALPLAWGELARRHVRRDGAHVREPPHGGLAARQRARPVPAGGEPRLDVGHQVDVLLVDRRVQRSCSSAARGGCAAQADRVGRR